MNDRFLRLKEVVERTGMTRTTLYRWIKDGKFPKQVKLGQASVAWRQSEVEEWMKDPTGWGKVA